MALFQSKNPPRVLYTPPPPPPPTAATGRAAQIEALIEQARSGSSSALAALGGAGLAGSIGATYVPEAGLYALTLNPYTALPAAALLIADLAGIIPSFAGKPKLLDTAQAAQRLLATQFRPLQDLGAQIAIFAKNGVPLSTGDPAYQEQIRQAVAGTVNTILAQYPLVGTPAQVDQLLRRALTSQQGTQGTAQLEQLLARSALLAPQNAARPAAAPLPPLIPSGAASVPQNAPQPSQPAPAGLPGELLGLWNSFQRYATAFEVGELAACLGSIVIAVTTESPTAAAFGVKCLEKLLITVVSQGAIQIVEGFRNYARQLEQSLRGKTPGRQPGSAPQMPPTPVPQPGVNPQNVPLVLNQPCEACMSPTQRAQYQREQQQLQKEIETETQQDTQQQLDRIQQQLDQLQQLEQQPLDQRNVQQELQQKQQLRQQLDMLSNQRGEPAPPGQPAPLVEISPEQVPIQQKASEALTFCVGCQSNEDAILFLNGEPSACSVIPGSTKPLIGGDHAHG